VIFERIAPAEKSSVETMVLLTPNFDSGQNLRFAPPLQSMYTPQSTWLMPGQMPGQKQDLLMNTSAVVTKKTNHELQHNAPVSNEFNVIVCIILLLGGIANLSMAKAFLLETEAQLVILCLFVFGVLEIGRNHLVSYFWYLSVHPKGFEKYTPEMGVGKEINKDATERFVIVFIDFVVFLLQLFIVCIWQITLGSLLAIASPNVWTLRGVLIFVVTCFMKRFISVAQGVMEVFGCCVCSDDSENDNYIMLLVWVELIMYCLVVIVLIVLVFVISVPKTDKNNTNPEKKLILLEQMMYQNTDSPGLNAACSYGIRKNELISVTNKLCTYDSNDVYKMETVSMKVFAWTRFYVFQHEIPDKDTKASADVLFCSNGFEQHWGRCKRQFSSQQGFWPEWNATVRQSAAL
jgi:hypothetical protein